MPGDYYDQLTQVAEPLLPLVEQMTFVPAYGGSAGAAPELVVRTQAFALVEAAGDLFAPTPAALRAAQPDAPTTDRLLQAFAQQAGKWPQLAPQLECAAHNISDGRCSVYARVGWRRLCRLRRFPDAGGCSNAACAVTALLGMDGPKTYLILVQNNHELRADGGFIAAIGWLTLDQGS